MIDEAATINGLISTGLISWADPRRVYGVEEGGEKAKAQDIFPVNWPEPTLSYLPSSFRVLSLRERLLRWIKSKFDNKKSKIMKSPGSTS